MEEGLDNWPLSDYVGDMAKKRKGVAPTVEWIPTNPPLSQKALAAGKRKAKDLTTENILKFPGTELERLVELRQLVSGQISALERAKDSASDKIKILVATQGKPLKDDKGEVRKNVLGIVGIRDLWDAELFDGETVTIDPKKLLLQGVTLEQIEKATNKTPYQRLTVKKTKEG